MKDPMDIWPEHRGAAPGNSFLSQDIVGGHSMDSALSLPENCVR